MDMRQGISLSRVPKEMQKWNIYYYIFSKENRCNIISFHSSLLYYQAIRLSPLEIQNGIMSRYGLMLAGYRTKFSVQHKTQAPLK